MQKAFKQIVRVEISLESRKKSGMTRPRSNFSVESVRKHWSQTSALQSASGIPAVDVNDLCVESFKVSLFVSLIFLSDAVVSDIPMEVKITKNAQSTGNCPLTDTCTAFLGQLSLTSLQGRIQLDGVLVH